MPDASELVGPKGRIASALDDLRINPTGLADRLTELTGWKVYPSTTNPWVQENGSPPTARYLVWLPEALGVDGHWLLTGEPPRKRTSQGRDSDQRAAAFDRVAAVVLEVVGTVEEGRRVSPLPDHGARPVGRQSGSKASRRDQSRSATSDSDDTG